MMNLRVVMVEGTDIHYLFSDDGGCTIVGPVSQTKEAGYLDDMSESEKAELDDSKWLVIDMVDMWQADSLEDATRRIEADCTDYQDRRC